MYDSLGKNGKGYQNALNDDNVSLFKACDGLFTNYGNIGGRWYPPTIDGKLTNSASLARSLNRQYDVRCGDCNPSWCMLQPCMCLVPADPLCHLLLMCM